MIKNITIFIGKTNSFGTNFPIYRSIFLDENNNNKSVINNANIKLSKFLVLFSKSFKHSLFIT